MARRKKEQPAVVDPFAALYPNVTKWVQDGWIEVGRDDCNRSFIRVLDIGGMIWEGKADYPSTHEALQAADAAIGSWLEENG